MQNYLSAEKELLTIRDFIRWGMTQLSKAEAYFGHGTDNAWDEMVYLILHTLKLPHEVNKAILDARLIEEERFAIAEILWKRVSEKVPTPYLVHEAWFAGIPFYVDQRVLIPRSPIAELIEKKFDPWIDVEKVNNILDLGTGSGCIAITAALAFPLAEVDAVDVSQDALAVAKINVDKHQVDDRVHLIESDVFNNLQSKVYDVIISNPPYVDQKDMQSLPREYHHEPKLALAAGQDGLEVVDRILKSAADHLNDYGILIVEVGNSAEALVEKYPNIPFIWLEFEHGHSEVFLLNKHDLDLIR